MAVSEIGLVGLAVMGQVRATPRRRRVAASARVPAKAARRAERAPHANG
jgi:6-phosphogluconate dehydrogenase